MTVNVSCGYSSREDGRLLLRLSGKATSEPGSVHELTASSRTASTVQLVVLDGKLVIIRQLLTGADPAREQNDFENGSS